MAWMKTRLLISKNFTPAQRLELADEVIRKIRRRTKSGLNKTGSSFPGYTKEYRKVKRKLGKSTSPVNLTLSNQMLTDLELLSHKSGALLIGYENGSQSNSKAEGNIKGTYGGAPKPGKKRDFLGIGRDDFTALKNKVKGLV